MTRTRCLLCSGILLFSIAVSAQAPQPLRPPIPTKPAPTTRSSHDKTMEQVWKNIKVLNGLPSDELVETMNYFRVSLGVNCDHCHVHSESSGLAPELDTKPQKQKT